MSTCFNKDYTRGQAHLQKDWSQRIFQHVKVVGRRITLLLLKLNNFPNRIVDHPEFRHQSKTFFNKKKKIRDL